MTNEDAMNEDEVRKQLGPNLGSGAARPNNGIELDNKNARVLK